MVSQHIEGSQISSLKQQYRSTLSPKQLQMQGLKAHSTVSAPHQTLSPG